MSLEITTKIIRVPIKKKKLITPKMVVERMKYDI